MLEVTFVLLVLSTMLNVILLIEQIRLRNMMKLEENKVARLSVKLNGAYRALHSKRLSGRLWKADESCRILNT